MSTADRVANQTQDIIERRAQPDLQMDVLDSELPTLEGEIETTRNQEEAEYIDALQALRELQVGDPVRWKIFRIDNPRGDKRLNGFIAEVGTSDLTQENLAKLWGGGKYRIRGTFSNGKFAGGKTIDIAGDVRPAETQIMMPQSSGSGFDMQAWMAFQQQQDAKREERTRQDRKDFLALALPIAGQIAAALIGRQPQPTQDLAALITALRPTVAPPDPNTTMKGTLETMLLMKRVMGGGEDGDSISSIATALAPYAGPVLQAFANRPPAQVMRRRPAPGSQPTQAAPARIIEQAPTPPVVAAAQPPVVLPMDTPSMPHAPTAPQTGVDLNAPSQVLSPEQQSMFAQVKPQVDALVEMAAGGADGTQTADIFFEQVMMNMDDKMYGQIATFIESPNAVQQLAVFNTGVTKHAAFFEAFRVRLMQRLAEETAAATNQVG